MRLGLAFVLPLDPTHCAGEADGRIVGLSFHTLTESIMTKEVHKETATVDGTTPDWLADCPDKDEWLALGDLIPANE